jgi:hypothetical protein
MKRTVLIFSCLVMISTGVRAQTDEPVKQKSIFSTGIGGFAVGDFGGGAKTKISGYEVSVNMGHFGGGIFVFFDAKYLETSLGYFMGVGKWEMETDIPGTSNQKIGDLSLSGINIGLLLKYPFVINSKLKLFPALGINYQAVLSAKLDNTEASHPDDLSGIWFQFGGGLDYSFSQKIYLRLEALYGLRPKNSLEEDYIDLMNYLFSGYSGIKTEAIPGHGPNIKLALGFNL